jgi:hypothetical protein
MKRSYLYPFFILIVIIILPSVDAALLGVNK